MKQFFDNLSGKQKLLLSVFLVSIISVTLTFFTTQNIFYTIIISIFIAGILWISKPIWLPEEYGKSLIRKFSLIIALCAISCYGFWQSFVANLFKSIIQAYFPELASKYPLINAPPAITLAFLFGVIWIVNYYTRDKTGMGIHPDPVDKDIPAPDFKSRLKAVSESLYDDLRQINKQTNWSPQLFTPLDAEVEVQTKNGTSKKVADLLKSIRSSKDRLFLVLGDPGSGKSVALRKLCQDLLDEAHKTGKIPIYINLKEWIVEKKWEDSSSITVEQLYDFVLSNIKNRDIVTSKFFDKYFERLYETGRLYFVLDSFDEIPAVLNEKENSELIKKLSQVIFKFLKGARQESQGILSSRFFRKPTSEFQTNTLIEIRPFTENKITQTLKRSQNYDDKLIKQLFKERIELVPIARNPFSAALIAEYMEDNNRLPLNQADLFASYIDNTFESCSERLEKKNLTKKQVIDCSIQIADEMFTNYGLEAPVNKLREKIDDLPFDDVIDVLKFARIGRLGTGDDNQFSFVHRRFCEYFAVQKLIENDENPDFDSIPTDSQWRDALVLYCEVADASKASAIADFCWQTIKKINNPQNLRVIHCMRFLRDAFRGRLECIESFRKELAEYILKQIDKKNNMISVKLAVECLGLLQSEDVDEGVVKAMELNNFWINETAFRACRHLGKISDELEKRFFQYFNRVSSVFIFINRKSLKFSLSLSEGFANINNCLKWKLCDFYLLIAAMFTALIIIPGPFMFYLIWSIFSLFLIKIFFTVRIIYIVLNLMTILLFTFLASLGVTVFCIGNKINYNFQWATIIKDIFYFKVLIVLNLSLYIRVYKLRYFKVLSKVFDSLNLLKSSPLTIIYVISFLIFIPLIYLSTDYLKEHPLIIRIILTIIIIVSISNYYKIIKEYLIYKKINFNKCNDRKYIYEYFTQLEKNSFLQSKFIRYLENNIKTVKGEWPSKDILKVSNKEANIRLAKLEEKWLGLDR